MIYGLEEAEQSHTHKHTKREFVLFFCYNVWKFALKINQRLSVGFSSSMSSGAGKFIDMEERFSNIC